MDDRELKNQLQCIVDEGILYNHKDMARILRDLGHVRYLDIHAGTERTSGDGYVMAAHPHPQSATIIVNKRIYINPRSFDYLQLGRDSLGHSVIDLVEGDRTLRIIPLSEPSPKQVETVSESYQAELLDRMFEDDFAEAYLEDEDDQD